MADAPATAKRPKPSAPAPVRVSGEPRVPPATWAPVAKPAAPAVPSPSNPTVSRVKALSPDNRSDFWHSVGQVARKDFLQHLRTKRLLVIGAFLMLSLMFITLILPVAILEEGDQAPDSDEPSNENTAFYFYMNASVFGGSFFIQLLAIVLTADAVCSEWSNRTIFLMLSKPVSRSAFVLGKLLGSLGAILPALVIIFSLQYAIVQPFFAGSPDAEDVGRFFGFIGVLCIGASAVASVSLFFSSLTRSNVQALILTLVTMFVVFPLVGNIGDFTYFADKTPGDIEDAEYDWSHYLSPERLLTTASDVLLDGSNGFGLSFVIPQFPAAHAWLSMVSGGLFVLLFTGLSILVVQRRNFE